MSSPQSEFTVIAQNAVNRIGQQDRRFTCRIDQLEVAILSLIVVIRISHNYGVTSGLNSSTHMLRPLRISTMRLMLEGIVRHLTFINQPVSQCSRLKSDTCIASQNLAFVKSENYIT